MSNMKSTDKITLNNHSIPTNILMRTLCMISISLIMPPYLYFKPRQINNVTATEGPLHEVHHDI